MLMSVKFERCFEDLTQLRMLKLFYMNLDTISGATFRSFRLFLVELHLDSCQIRILDVDTLKNFSKLTVLSLKDNSITYLPDTIFTSLTSLTTLDVSENNLKVTSGTLLRPLRNLENLFFGGDLDYPMNLTFGEEFLNMTRLRQIAFSARTHSLNSDTFHHLRHSPISDIQLRFMFMGRISKEAFLPLRNITSLSLATPFPSSGSFFHDAFYGLNGSSLRTLYLSSDKLGDYSAALFEGLTENNVTSLVMNISKIRVIKKGMFSNLVTVSSLDLSNANINQLENDSLKDLVELSTLIIDV